MATAATAAPGPRSLRRLAAAAIVGTVAAAAALVGVAAPAQAAEIPDAITNVTVTSTAEDGTYAKQQTITVAADWHVPDGTPAGSTFSLQLPDEFVGLGAEFPLLTKAGDTVATCVMTTAVNRLDCTLTDYVTTHPQDIGGSLELYAKLSSSLDAGTNHVIRMTVNGEVVEIPITVQPGGDPGPARPFEGQGFGKWGTLSDDGTYIGWWMSLPAPAGGLDADYPKTVVTDTLGAGHTFDADSLEFLDASSLNAAGTDPEWVRATEGVDYTITSTDSGFTLTFDGKQGHYYAIWYATKPDAGSAGPWANSATIAGNGVDVPPVEWTVTAHGGGGTGSGVLPPVEPTTPPVEPTVPPTQPAVPPVTMTPAPVPTAPPASAAAPAAAQKALASTGPWLAGPGMIGASVLLAVGIGSMLVANHRSATRRKQSRG
ncbi:Ig-like domain-containing protein [Plantibacter sp. YIM 135347]|uniref:Ig-like domain-containing protein n=1 Tax=Plantibacter sp. YIM 135347 TaxID=3423919 RepID=UPI003D3563A9